MDYQAIIATPFGKLGIRCSEETLIGIDFLSADARARHPGNALAEEVCRQLKAYLVDPAFRFDLPLDLQGTPHQHKVWRAMCAIPCGQTQTYGELAARIGSSPRAVGQACGNNPVPIVVPCHRVVSSSGLGGFMHRGDAGALDIKRWLLAHERR